jgi:cytochrome c-type biogenesis protein CcmH/NrfF
MTLSNAVDSFESVLADTRELAREQGAGANARANWLLRVVRGAANGALDTSTKDKNDRDHAHRLYEAYTVACSSRNVHNTKTVISKACNLRKGIELGCKMGDDAVAVMNDAVATYGVMSKDETIKVHPPFEAFNLVVREQLKSATKLTRDQLRSIMSKETAEADVATHVRTALRAMERAYKLDPNDRITEAMDAVSGALAFLTSEVERADALAQLAALQAKLGIAA